MEDSDFNPYLDYVLEVGGSRFADTNFESYQCPPGDTEAAAKVMAWCDAFSRDTRLAPFLYGATGTGKTHLGIAALRLLAEKRWPVRYFDVPTRLDKMRSDIGHHASKPVTAGLKQAHIILLDELGAVKPTDWVIEQVYLLTDWLWKERKVVIVTSNKDYSELAVDLGERTVSRLVDLTRKVQVGGEDYRTLRAKGVL